MAKPEKRKRAQELRRQGMSINVIAERVGAAKSSVSGWCKDIQLTHEQEEALRKSNARREAQVKGARANVEIHRKKRRAYQEEGRQKAREGDPLHLAACMLYWAEGRKSRTELRFSNSDTDMIVMFLHFLRDTMEIPDNTIKFSIHCYTHQGLTQQEIEKHWLDTLSLSSKNMDKTIVNNQPSSSQQKGRILLYGVCQLRVSSVRYMQHIYGAIQEYAGIDKPEWLDL